MVSIRSRSSWGARSPAGPIHTVAPDQRTGFVLHYSLGSTSQSVRSIQDYHINDNGWSDIGYNGLVDEEGTAYIGRGWDAIGAHAAGANTPNYGWCYIGRDGMTEAAKATLVEIYDMACERSDRTLTRLGHRDLNATTCPGDDNYSWWKSPSFRDVTRVGGESMSFVGLRKGDEGQLVRDFQKYLDDCGYPPVNSFVNSEWDGIFGDGVEQALVDLRRDNGSGVTSSPHVTYWAMNQCRRAHWKAMYERYRDPSGNSDGGSLPTEEDITITGTLKRG